MKTLLLSALLAAIPGGEREKGLKLYQAGRYEEAAAAFRLAIASEGDSAELQYNLALASWRAGDLATAETAVEKYAALAKTTRVDLHAGVLGGVRFDEAKNFEDGADDAVQQQEDPLPILEQALAKAEQARDHFVRGATETPSAELLRNAERALRYVEELREKIEELEKQREEQEDQQNDQEKQEGDDNDENKDEQQDQKPDEQQKGEGEQNEQQKGDPKPDEAENKQGAQDPPEPEQKTPPDEQQQGSEEKPGEQQPPPEPEQKPGEAEGSATQEQQPEPQPRNDAPGEAAEGRQLSPEQTQRLLEQLQDLEGKLKALRSQAKTRRKPVERDW